MWNSLIVRATAAFCVACYLWAYLPALRGQPRSTPSAGTLFWTAAWVWLVIHTATAFHLVHGWSHLAAWEDTARQTQEVLGISFGNGVWFNYAAIVLWGGDVARRIKLREGRASKSTARRLEVIWSRALEAYLALMMFFATVVFGPHYWKAIAAGLLVLVLFSRWREGRAARRG